MLVIALIGILSVAFMVRLRDVQAAAERAAVSSALDSLQAGLWAAAAARMVGKGRGAWCAWLGRILFSTFRNGCPATGAPGWARERGRREVGFLMLKI